jgi:hypothetical protein
VHFKSHRATVTHCHSDSHNVIVKVPFCNYIFIIMIRGASLLPLALIILVSALPSAVRSSVSLLSTSSEQHTTFTTWKVTTELYSPGKGFEKWSYMSRVPSTGGQISLCCLSFSSGSRAVRSGLRLTAPVIYYITETFDSGDCSGPQTTSTSTYFNYGSDYEIVSNPAYSWVKVKHELLTV